MVLKTQGSKTNLILYLQLVIHEFLRFQVNPYQSRNLFSWIKTRQVLRLIKSRFKSKPLNELCSEDPLGVLKQPSVRCLCNSIKFWNNLNTLPLHLRSLPTVQENVSLKLKESSLLPTQPPQVPVIFSISKTGSPMTPSPRFTISRSLE